MTDSSNSGFQSQDIQNASIDQSSVQLSQGENVVQNQGNGNQTTFTNITHQYIQQVPRKQEKWSDRQKDLLEQVQNDVRQRLTDSSLRSILGDQEVWISLTLEEKLEAVEREQLQPRRRLMMAGEDGAEQVEIGSDRTLEVFLRPDVGKKLLILGNPGAGKTTTLLQLAEDLLKQALAQPGRALPVIFELSTWKSNGQPIRG